MTATRCTIFPVRKAAAATSPLTAYKPLNTLLDAEEAMARLGRFQTTILMALSLLATIASAHPIALPTFSDPALSPDGSEVAFVSGIYRCFYLSFRRRLPLLCWRLGGRFGTLFG